MFNFFSKKICSEFQTKRGKHSDKAAIFSVGYFFEEIYE